MKTLTQYLKVCTHCVKERQTKVRSIPADGVERRKTYMVVS